LGALVTELERRGKSLKPVVLARRHPGVFVAGLLAALALYRCARKRRSSTSESGENRVRASPLKAFLSAAGAAGAAALAKRWTKRLFARPS